MTTKNPGPLYPNLKPWELEPHYCRHAAAMTEEGLDSKAAIAEQLAWRDQQVEEFQARVAELESFFETPSGEDGARFRVGEDTAAYLASRVAYYLPKPLPGQAILERAHASLVELRERADKASKP